MDVSPSAFPSHSVLPYGIKNMLYYREIDCYERTGCFHTLKGNLPPLLSPRGAPFCLVCTQIGRWKTNILISTIMKEL